MLTVQQRGRLKVGDPVAVYHNFYGWRRDRVVLITDTKIFTSLSSFSINRIGSGKNWKHSRLCDIREMPTNQ